MRSWLLMSFVSHTPLELKTCRSEIFHSSNKTYDHDWCLASSIHPTFFSFDTVWTSTTYIPFKLHPQRRGADHFSLFFFHFLPLSGRIFHLPIISLDSIDPTIQLYPFIFTFYLFLLLLFCCRLDSPFEGDFRNIILLTFNSQTLFLLLSIISKAKPVQFSSSLQLPSKGNAIAIIR